MQFFTYISFDRISLKPSDLFSMPIKYVRSWRIKEVWCEFVFYSIFLGDNGVGKEKGT